MRLLAKLQKARPKYRMTDSQNSASRSSCQGIAVHNSAQHGLRWGRGDSAALSSSRQRGARVVAGRCVRVGDEKESVGRNFHNTDRELGHSC
jgi:hypothetical protein